MWVRPLNQSGHVIYRCEAKNSRGNEKSNSIIFIVGGKVQYRVLIWNVYLLTCSNFLAKHSHAIYGTGEFDCGELILSSQGYE